MEYLNWGIGIGVLTIILLAIYVLYYRVSLVGARVEDLSQAQLQLVALGNTCPKSHTKSRQNGNPHKSNSQDGNHPNPEPYSHPQSNPHHYPPSHPHGQLVESEKEDRASNHRVHVSYGQGSEGSEGAETIKSGEDTQKYTESCGGEVYPREVAVKPECWMKPNLQTRPEEPGPTSHQNHILIYGPNPQRYGPIPDEIDDVSLNNVDNVSEFPCDLRLGDNPLYQ